ncbi:NAD(P)-binding protein [Polychaeton citri CBS 116435]|uniref:NAD(P)-binding protein n=1 Tax=Polychaeton citri CBS 116435 TaxID=1314669 RepID=A0A9P4Q2Q6_9PEZI|nr:NAD(P)-binding protein [Polychaeton citri CBS 116435]
MSSSILVLGAGELGDQVLAKLSTHPHRNDFKVALMLRPSAIESQDDAKRAKIDTYRSLDIDVLPGDLVNDDLEHLSSKFKGFHTIISCTGMTFPPGTQLKIVKSVLQAGAKRYFPWQYGVDYDVIGRGSAQNLFTEQLDVRDLLRSQSATEWVIVSTGMFSSFLIEPSFGIINEDRSVVTAIGSWESRITVTDVSEIGTVVAEIALACPQVSGVVHIASDTVSMRRIADVADEILGKKLERRLKTVSQLKEELAAEPDDGMRKYRVVFAEGTGVSWDLDGTFNAKKGIHLKPFTEWAKSNLH